MSPNFNIQKLILAPLDWGLGHATRCIPIIRALQMAGYEVILAAEGAQAHLLRKEFPDIQVLPLQGYRVRYSKRKWTLPFRLLAQLPRLRRVIREEKKWLDRIISEHAIDLVISDNRYGLSTRKAPCVFITHQLTVKAPFGWAEKMIQRVLYSYINRFNTCWVPDVEGGENAAGLLSHPAVMPETKVQYIGLLSRFERRDTGKKYDFCVLLSGPEPQRSLLEEKILREIADLQAEILLVRGKPGSEEVVPAPAHVTVVNHLPGGELEQALLQSEYIVCRSGYTTVMEILSLGKKAILIPTPGQTEQEYLARKLQNENICMYVSQDALQCQRDFPGAALFPFKPTDFRRFQEDEIKTLLAAV